MDERALAQRLITYDTSTADGIRSAAGFVKGWLEAREIHVEDRTFNSLPVLTSTVGPAAGPTVIFHGHIDVVPAHDDQFDPRIEGDRLIGRGGYDMKGGLAAMMCAMHDIANQNEVRVHFICVPDEETEDVDVRSTDQLIKEGFTGDFAITGEPTDLHVGVEAKGVLTCRILVTGVAAHGSTPWLGENAVLRSVDVFRQIERLPFSTASSELFDRPSINLGRINGGDALNKVPDECIIDVDIRYLPTQDPGEILSEIRTIEGIKVLNTYTRIPAHVSSDNTFVKALVSAVGANSDRPVLSVGRDGASDAVSFQEVGIPAVEFGPLGGGHHGPHEWVSLTSLTRYRQALKSFVLHLPQWLNGTERGSALRAIDGGRT